MNALIRFLSLLTEINLMWFVSMIQSPDLSEIEFELFSEIMAVIPELRMTTMVTSSMLLAMMLRPFDQQTLLALTKPVQAEDELNNSFIIQIL